MKVLFLSREPAVCRLMAKKLGRDEFECTVADDVMGFYNSVMDGNLDTDIVVCDFRIFQLSIFNVYEFLSKSTTIIPLIFYNDPFPDGNGRIMYWIAQNEQLYNAPCLESFIPLFEKINAVIEDPSVHPYISLLQPPLPLPGDEDEAGTAGRKIDVRLFRKRNRLQPGLYKLFQIFYENQMKELSLAELSLHMWGTRSKQNTVYSYISRLKKCIQSDCLVKIDILRTSTGYYEMTVY